MDPKSVMEVARGDYGANAGARVYDGIYGAWANGPPSLTDGDNFTGWQTVHNYVNGVIYAGSKISAAHIRDGLANTYIIGEKYLAPDHYTNGNDHADNENMYVGDNQDNMRWTGSGTMAADPMYNVHHPPYQDRGGFGGNFRSFGSAHAGSFHAAMCDGSVQSISYNIAQEIHYRLGNRKDGLIVDGASF